MSEVSLSELVCKKAEFEARAWPEANQRLSAKEENARLLPLIKRMADCLDYVRCDENWGGINCYDGWPKEPGRWCKSCDAMAQLREECLK